jgi:acetyl esterase/lipase
MLCWLVAVRRKNTNISYQSTTVENNNNTKIKYFVPRKSKQLNQVLIFVHGGNWNSGRKGTYDLLGRNFARKA